MKYRTVFDIIGPVMIGPSSSHTAGAARIGRTARALFGRKPKKAIITFYGSFAKTYRGHGTDVAIVGGLLDFDTFDQRISRSLDIAKEQGLEVTFRTSEEVLDHPNTARVYLEDDERSMEVVGISIGGGKIEITEWNGFDIKLTGNSPALFVLHRDRFGAIASVASVLAKYKINIGFMQVSRKEKGASALMIIETDQKVGEEIQAEVAQQPDITQVSAIF